MSRKLSQLLAVIMLSVFLPNVARAEDAVKRRRNHDFSVNPLMIFQYALPLTYHKAISDTTAIGLGAVLKHNGKDYWSVGGALSLKFFLSNTPFEDSWYVEPRLDLSLNSYKSTSYWALDPSVIAGHTWVWASGFTINLGLGIAYPIPFIDSKIFGGKYWNWGLSGVQPAGEFSIGWAW
jgi:hypothetical protein